MNKYQTDSKTEVETLDIDNTAVREAQIRRLKASRVKRDANKCKQALDRIVEAAENDTGNLLALAVDAARHRASVGEISDALEGVWGRHRAISRSVSGVYGSAYADDQDFKKIVDEVEQFAQVEGRRPRILVCKLGQDGHDRGAKVIATAFADMGFDVDIGPLFQLPQEAVREAIENDVHIIGVSSQAAGHKTLVPQLMDELKQQGAEDIFVVCGGVIPPQDHQMLFNQGVSAIYGPGTNITQAAREVLALIRQVNQKQDIKSSIDGLS